MAPIKLEFYIQAVNQGGVKAMKQVKLMICGLETLLLKDPKVWFKQFIKPGGLFVIQAS